MKDHCKKQGRRSIISFSSLNYSRTCGVYAWMVLLGLIIILQMGPSKWVSPSYAAQTSSLVAAYSFDENSGNVVHDTSLNGNNGGVASPLWTSQGRYGGALQFGASDNRVIVPDADSLDLTTGMTISAWVYPTSNRPGWDTVIYKERPGDLVYGLYHLHLDKVN